MAKNLIWNGVLSTIPLIGIQLRKKRFTHLAKSLIKHPEHRICTALFIQENECWTLTFTQTQSAFDDIESFELNSKDKRILILIRLVIKELVENYDFLKKIKTIFGEKGEVFDEVRNWFQDFILNKLSLKNYQKMIWATNWKNLCVERGKWRKVKEGDFFMFK